MVAVEVVLGVSAVAALLVALGQLRVGLHATKVQRVIDLHRDLTTGEVGAARNRLATLLWKHGELLAGRNQCHSPTWAELLPDVLGGGDRGLLGEYKLEDKIVASADAEPMRDLYSVLWCFERVEAGRAGRALDKRMLSARQAHAEQADRIPCRLVELGDATPDRGAHSSHQKPSEPGGAA